MPLLDQLEPAAVWRHFSTLLNTPRPSKHEDALRDTLRTWANARGLATMVDRAGNLIIRKPATAGMENRPGVILQGHLDMVCQKNHATTHDFLRDPIQAELQGDWLVAPNTTLGADNGIGVALALALLESTDLPHPPLEVLLTVDEEAGMGGALGLEPGLLQGSLMINIDTEDWGEFYLGCAGGVDVNVSFRYSSEALPSGFANYEIDVGGLRGGHSGVDIHLERGNAIKILVRLLRSLEGRFGNDIRLVELEGGSARNALAREARARVALPRDLAERVASRIEDFDLLVRGELAGVDEGVSVRFGPEDGIAHSAMSGADQRNILAALHAAPHGVRRMSQRVAGVVETSNNLGVLKIADGSGFANLMVRSLLDSGVQALAAEIESLFSLAGAAVQTEGAYPGWAPNPDSDLLKLFQRVYQREFASGPAAVKVIHAGLECGILKSKYPQLDIVSFGPDIRGAHAPGERVNIESVAKCWKLLAAVVAAIPAEHESAASAN